MLLCTEKNTDHSCANNVQVICFENVIVLVYNYTLVIFIIFADEDYQSVIETLDQNCFSNW